ncbi:MAG: Gfo/Idh/MocA family oxidoreductase [Alphaproteobacteria bacterium]|nr:Gfo/Idh/MocA family oxidoreductase [Alphaproteobacteria bacterium]
MTLRYAIIGSGMMGQEHIRNLNHLDGATVTAVTDPDPGMREQAAMLAGAEAFSDHRALLSADLADALIIASPNHTHHNILMDVLSTNLPIMVEKPLCSTVTQAREVKHAAAGRPVWVAMEYRYMPAIARLIEEVENGRVGRLRMLAIREHRFPFLEKVGNWNRFARTSGGTLVEKCCHFFDLMRLIVGAEPTRIYASGAQDVNHLDERIDGEMPDILDNAYVIVDFENGVRAMLDLCMFAEASRDQEEIAATGDRGKVECGIPSSTLTIGERRPVERMGVALPLTRETIPVDPDLLELGDHNGATFFQHEHFLRMVQKGGRPEVTVEDGLKAVIMGAAAERSVKEGVPIVL